MKVLWTLTPEQMGGTWEHPGLHEALCQWVRDNGIDPEDVYAKYPVTVEKGDGQKVIRFHCFLRNDDGGKYLNARDEAANVETTVPLRVDLPTLPASTTRGET